MTLGKYNIEAASSFIVDNIDLIEREQFDEVFNNAYHCNLVPDVVYMFLKSDIKFLHLIDFIYPEMFEYCNEFETITIPNNINFIGADSFHYNRKLKQVNFTADSSVQVIEKSAFASCENLQSIILPDSIELIEEDAFFKCSKLTAVRLPDAIDRINSSTFFSCYNLTNITLPNSLVEISSFSFSNCHLTDIKLPPLIQRIESQAFENCRFLKNITLTGNIPKIYVEAFENCFNLETITYNGTTNQFQDNYGKDSWYRKKHIHTTTEPKIICNDGIIDFNH